MPDLPQLDLCETRFTGGEFGGERFRYWLLQPQSLEAGRTYPLVLFLHGAGERGTEPNKVKKHFLPQMGGSAFRERYPCFAIAPQCRSGYWWTGPDDDVSGRRNGDDLGLMLRMALQCVDEVIAEHPINPERLYLTGLSMGGFAAWKLAARQPNRWAAVVPICGGGDRSDASVLVNVPIWAVHGEADDIVPVEYSREMIAALRAAGGDPHYTEYRGVGHDSWTLAYSDPRGVIPWMFSHCNADHTEPVGDS